MGVPCAVRVVIFLLHCSNFDSSSTVSKQEVDAKLDEWETLGARVRKEACRLQRQGATGP